MDATQLLTTILAGSFGLWCLLVVARTTRELAPDLLRAEDRDRLEELGDRIADGWGRLVDRLVDWLQPEPEPEPVPVPVHWPREPSRR